MAPRVLASLALAVVLLLAACGAEVPADGDAVRPPGAAPAAAPSPVRAKPLPAGYRLHTEPVPGLRFPVPATGVIVEARHFDPTLPARKFRHSIRLLGARGTAVLIDVWDNPQKLELHAWFAQHLAFLVGAATHTSERAMTARAVPGILLDEPASEQAASQAIAVFALGDQVFRVTAIDPEGDAAAREMFEHVIDALEPGVAP